MKERPITMLGSSVRGTMAGSKDQTRRICKQADMLMGMRPGAPDWADAVYPARESGWIAWKGLFPPGPRLEEETKFHYKDGFQCPYGRPGDRLWVRETWIDNWGAGVIYRADYDPDSFEYGAKGWKSPYRMFRKDSRLLLEITAIRVEQVQDISLEDCLSEGITVDMETHAGQYWREEAIAKYAALWDSINAKRAPWSSNPWVWVISYQRIEPDATR